MLTVANCYLTHPLRLMGMFFRYLLINQSIDYDFNVMMALDENSEDHQKSVRVSAPNFMAVHEVVDTFYSNYKCKPHGDTRDH